MRFIIGQLDVAETFGIGYFFTFGDGILGDKKMVLIPSTRLEGRRYLPPPCSRRGKLLAVEISQVTFLGLDQRVWREDLAPVTVSIAAAAVATIGCV